MTKREVLSLSFKLIGIYCLIETITGLPLFVNEFFAISHFSQSVGINIYIHTVGIMIRILWWIGLVYLFFRYSDYLAKRFILINTEIPFGDIIQLEKGLFPLSLIIIGVGCCISAVSNILGKLSNIFDHSYGQSFITSFNRIIGPLVLLTIGVYLATGGEHLIRLAFREKRKPPLEEPDERDL
ncbi:MAG: hypothetical protein ACE14V_03260 [bacterium]